MLDGDAPWWHKNRNETNCKVFGPNAAYGEARRTRLALGLFFEAACPAAPFEVGMSALRRGDIVVTTCAPKTQQVEQLATSRQDLVGGLADA